MTRRHGDKATGPDADSHGPSAAVARALGTWGCILTVLFLFVILISTGCDDSRRLEAERPLLVFAAIADPHVVEENGRTHDDPRYFRALTISLELLRNAVRDVNAHRPSVDLVLVLGDISDHGYLRELQLGKAVLDSLNAPWVPVRGNHDARQGYWEEVVGEGHRNYSFDRGAIHFVVADCSVETVEGVAIEWGEEVREWVRQDLEVHAHMPTFFATHANLYERTWSAAFDDRDVYGEHRGAEEMRAVLEGAGNVVAVITGHVHANRLELHEGIPYVEVGSTCIAHGAVRYFCVYRDRTEMSCEPLSDAALQAYAEAVARRSPRSKDVDAALRLIDGCDGDRVAVLTHPVLPGDGVTQPLQIVNR